MAAGCGRFYFVESGNDCFDIAQEAGIALADFYTWNPAVGTSCGSLAAGVYACIGLGGPIYTTIKSGNPVAATPTPYQVSITPASEQINILTWSFTSPVWQLAVSGFMM